MTLDEAIAHAREVAEDKRADADWKFRHGRLNADDCISCAEEHEQLAEWLEELKDYRDKNKMVVRVDVENMDSIKDKIEELSKYAEIQYEKAIDDFVESVKNLIAGSSVIRFKDIDEIAEQLKAGENRLSGNKKVIELSGGSLSSNLVMVARAVNGNAEVLKEAVQKIEELSAEIDRLKETMNNE